jgi:hypothetical protein
MRLDGVDERLEQVADGNDAEKRAVVTHDREVAVTGLGDPRNLGTLIR